MTADSQQAEREAAVDAAREDLDAYLLIQSPVFNDDVEYNAAGREHRDAFEAAARAAGRGETTDPDYASESSHFAAGFTAGRGEAAELEALFALQHTRTVEADKLWRGAHPGNDLTAPDLGVLLTWLLERNEALEGALRGLVKSCPSTAEMRLLAVRIAGSNRELIDSFMEQFEGNDEALDTARALIPSEGDKR